MTARRRSLRYIVRAGAAAIVFGCAPASPGTEIAPSPAPASATGTLPERGQRGDVVPEGYGTLRQEDIALRAQVFGVAMRAIPLDESVIRVLSPDSYRALRDLEASRRGAVTEIIRRYGLTRPTLWYIAFYGVEQGEARFSPLDVVISSAGRDYRPVDVVPLTPGFGAQRLEQRETQSGIYVFDGTLDVNQPLTLVFQTARDQSWDAILRRIEAERTLIRARSGRAPR